MKSLVQQIIILILIFIFLLTITIPTLAEQKLSLRKALESGINNNSSILDSKGEVESLERELKRMEAGQDWQIGLSGNYFIEEKDVDIDSGAGNNNQIGDTGTNEDSINININKQFEYGFSINPEIEIIPEDMSSEFSISAEQQVLPFIPSEAERNYFRTKKELAELKRSLEKSKADQIVFWLETYYNLIELKKSLNLIEKRLELAENELKEMEERQEVEEAGKQELMSARLEVKEIEAELHQTKNNFAETERNLYNSLGLKDDLKVKIEEESSFLKLIEVLTHESNLTEKEISELMKELKKVDNELLSNREQRKILEKEKKWEQKGNSPELTLNSNYDSMSENTSVSFSLSYDLYDGGIRKLDLEDIEEDIITNKRKYEEIYQEKRTEFVNLLEQIDLSRKELSTGKLRLEQAILEKDIAKKQKNEGSITQSEYENMEVAKKEAEINVKSEENQILLDKLNLISFVNPEKIITILEAGE